MFTLHNKELLEVKRLKPAVFMTNILKANSKVFSNKCHSLYLPYFSVCFASVMIRDCNAKLVARGLGDGWKFIPNTLLLFFCSPLLKAAD